MPRQILVFSNRAQARASERAIFNAMLADHRARSGRTQDTAIPPDNGRPGTDTTAWSLLYQFQDTGRWFIQYPRFDEAEGATEDVRAGLLMVGDLQEWDMSREVIAEAP